VRGGFNERTLSSAIRIRVAGMAGNADYLGIEIRSLCESKRPYSSSLVSSSSSFSSACRVSVCLFPVFFGADLSALFLLADFCVVEVVFFWVFVLGMHVRSPDGGIVSFEQ
jgi:hypothetical protein